MSWIFDCFARTETPENSDEPPPPPPRPPPKLSYETLMKQDASTTSTIIQIFESSKLFAEVGTAEANAIIQRDHEDDEKLAAGIQISIEKGVLDPLGSEGFAAVPTYKTIDVIGKSPEAVADIILKDMGEATTKGGLMVLCGLSGTGRLCSSGPPPRRRLLPPPPHQHYHYHHYHHQHYHRHHHHHFFLNPTIPNLAAVFEHTLEPQYLDMER